MRIRFLKAWASPEGDQYSAGNVIDTSDDEAAELIKAATAVEHKAADPAPNPVPAPSPAVSPEITELVKSNRETADQIKSLVAKLHEQAVPTRVPRRPGATGIEVGPPELSKDPKGGFKSFGHFVTETRDAAVRRDTPETLKKWDDLCVKAPAGSSITEDASLGFLVPTEFRATLMEKEHGASVFQQRCFTIPIARPVEIPFINETSRATGSRSGGIQVYWVAEGTAGTSSKPKAGKLKLQTHKLIGLVYGTNELITDSVISVEPLLTRLFSQEISFMIDEAIFQGTGAGQPKGIITDSGVYVSIAKETGQAAATIEYANIAKMWARLWRGSRGNSAWFINQDCWPQILELNIGVGTAGQPVFVGPGQLPQAPAGAIFGRPIIESEQCKTLGTLGDIVLADMSQYVYAPHASGLQVMSSLHFKFDTDEDAMRFTMRCDGQSWWNSSLTPKNGTATQSPFVVLATRA